MRALGVDVGERRIGLAVSDPTGTIASPLDTVTRRRGKRPPWRAMEETARRHDVGQLVVGLPLDLEGEENEWCAEVRVLGDEFGRRLDVPVDYVDERMTSVRAERAVRSVGLPRSRREEKGRVDAAAAALILQSWLDARGGPR
jgi:putative Holliday junction resolvase